MASLNYSLLFTAITIATVLVNVGFLAFLFTRYAKFPRPTLLALLAFGLMIFTTVARMGFNTFAPRFVGSEAFMAANVVFSVISTASHFGSLFLLVAAIYSDRRKGPAETDSFENVGQSTLTPENPYGPPKHG